MAEDSTATGVDGNQNDNTAANSGAAYIIDLDANPGTTAYGIGASGGTGAHTFDVSHAPMINSPNVKITGRNAQAFSQGLGLVTDSQDVPGGDPFGLGVLLHCDFVFATELFSCDFNSDGTGYSETVGTSIPNSNALITAR